MLCKRIIVLSLFLFAALFVFVSYPLQVNGSDPEFVFDEISLFEGGYDLPEESQITYSTNFPKSTTRYVWCKVVLKNLLYNIREQQHQVICQYYDADMSLFGEIEDSFLIKPEWEYSWIPLGLGWEEPGNWPGGTYTIHVLIDGKKIGEKQFTVYNDIPELEFESLQFFESGYDVPEVSELNYTTRFPKSKTRYIYFMVNVKNLLWNKESQIPMIIGRYYNPDGSFLADVDALVDIPADWEYADVWQGWGWDEPGNWSDGTYRVEILFGNKKVAEKQFFIYDDILKEDYVSRQDINDLIDRGVGYLDKGDFDSAILEFNKALEIDPGNGDAYYNRGVAYYDKGEYERAISDYTKAIEINPKDTDAYNNRGLIYYEKSDYEKAISDYTKAIEIDPMYADTYYNRALAYYNKGEYDTAISDYTKVIELSPKDTDAYNNRGIIYYERGDYDKAISDYTKTIEIDPGYVDAYFNRGIIYYDRQDYDRAISDYTKVIELDPRDEDAYYNLGLAYDQKGKKERAITDYTKVTEKPEKEKEEPLQKPKPLKEETVEKRGKYLEIKDIEFDNIFPVLFKYYDEHPIGRAVLRNWEDTPITNIKVSLLIKRYMDSPKECKAPYELKGGEEKEIELYALFTDKVLEITEGTKVACEIILNYTYNGKLYESREVETVRLFDRNATMWDDNRKAAAFVTARDPAVLKFSKNIAGAIKEKGSKAVNQNLRMAMAIHEALSLYKMSYVIDPITPYKEFSKKKMIVDFLQFPKQTLDYRAGDCDDLSILYSAMLESVGIETAFITIPGHIFLAFSLDMSPEEARKSFLRADELIFRDKNTWIPVEATAIDGGFLNAWQLGAKQWREAVAREKAGFDPMHDSWKVYEPVGLPGEGVRVDFPSRDSLVKGYLEEVIKFIDREIYPRIAQINSEIKKSGGSPKSINKLGVLYARYWLMDRAEREFKKILSKNENYVPALMNMGHIYYLNGDMEKALEYYEKASESAPDNPIVLLSIARANHELENYGTVRRVYDKLKLVDPDLAIQFAYLDMRGEEAVRAASIGSLKEIVVWEEE